MRVLAYFSLVTLFLSAPLQAQRPVASKASTSKDGWIDLLPSIKTDSGVAGEWQKSKESISVNAARNARIGIPFRPGAEYDFRVSFTRTTGVHSVALIFVAGGKQATFEIDAWGEHLAGIQNLKGQDIRKNASLKRDQQLENGKRYTATVQVRRNQIQALLDGQVVSTVRSEGRILAYWICGECLIVAV